MWVVKCGVLGYGVATYGCFEVWGMMYLQLEQYLRLGLCMRLGLYLQ